MFQDPARTPLPLESVQCPEGIVEIRGEAHPQKVRDQEPGRGLRDSGERPNGEQDRNPQDDDLPERRARSAQTEEDHRPQEIEEQTDTEHAQRTPHFPALQPLFPHQEDRPAHERVEQSPDRREHPARGRQLRLYEAGVPTGDGRRREHRPRDPGQLAGQDGDGQFRTFIHMCNAKDKIFFPFRCR